MKYKCRLKGMEQNVLNLDFRAVPLRRSLCSAPCAERANHGQRRCYRAAERGDGVRYVSEAGVHRRIGISLRPALSGRTVQADGRRTALLREDELDELYHAIHHRGYHLFPLRALPCAALRIYAEPAGRYLYLPAASAILQMVALGA